MRDYMIRQTQHLEARSAALCECGHANAQHHELPRELIDVAGSLATGHLLSEPNPEHRPLHFHCDVDGCSCVLAPEASAPGTKAGR
jgi:hypothetical protein